jgi:ABC-type glycerol-3-phosphate transport system substrate-binding protein
MEELVAYAEQLTVRDDAGELTQIGFVPDFSRSHLDLYSQMLGGFWLGEDGGDLTVDDQSVIDAMNWQLQFYALYSPEEAQAFLSSFTPYTPQTQSGHPYFAGRRLNCQQCHHLEPANEDKMPDLGFYDGKVAMIVDGEWQMGPNGIDHFQPELNYGVAPFPPPSGHPERANTTIVQGPVAVIPADGRDRDAAGELLVWMMSADKQGDFAAGHTLLPVSHLAAQDSRITQMPNFQMFMELLAQPNATYRVASSATAEFNEILGQGEKGILHKGGDPSYLLDALQAEPSP